LITSNIHTMKTLIALLFGILILPGFSSLRAQNTSVKMPVDPETKLITYKEVVTSTGTPEELYNRAIAWINKQYKNPADVTKVRDFASGVIEILHRIDLEKTEKGSKVHGGFVDYSMKLEMKDGRYRYTINNFTLKTISRQPIEQWMDKNSPSYTPIYEDYLKQVDEYTRKLIDSLKQGMQPPAAKKPDTW
jgi:Domain of unknown function (DUF4468) with TBP-like fold